MPIAAAPEYLGKDFESASPGLRFGMYLELWGVDSRTGRRLWTTHDENYRKTGKNREERRFEDDNKTPSLKKVAALTQDDQEATAGVLARQQAIIACLPANETLSLIASSVAPFTTGLGNEHPLENGFAFLNPYGLPYLPGSGVKGVVRRAAEELARGDWDDTRGWSDARDYALPTSGDDASAKPLKLSMIDVLFGREPDAGDQRHVRGALDFWDVLPSMHRDQLAVEIMTPHQSHYYQDDRKKGQGSATPHDSGAPNPIGFLTVPPESRFTFHVRCHAARLRRIAPRLAEDDRWRCLVEAAFEHAFAWLGFGAKTAVGYGAMRRDRKREDRARRDAEACARKAQEAKEREERWAGMDPIDRDIETLLAGRQDKGMPETTAIRKAIEAGRWTGADKAEVAKRLKERMQREGTWKETSRKKNPGRDKDYQNTLRVRGWLGGD